jgi:CheY-like chemotaxis protein
MNFEQAMEMDEEKITLTKDRVLIVDDEPFNIDSLKIALQCATIGKKDFNFKGRVDTAYNGINAVDTVRKRYQEGLNFKFIMMDCNMPQMDGYEATR